MEAQQAACLEAYRPEVKDEVVKPKKARREIHPAMSHFLYLRKASSILPVTLDQSGWANLYSKQNQVAVITY